MLGFRFCARAFSSCGKRGPLFIVVRGPLTITASLVAEHRLQTRRLSNCGSRAQLLRGMWDLPRPGLEPVSPALAGRFSTTAPSGKPLSFYSFLIKLTPSNQSGLRSVIMPSVSHNQKVNFFNINVSNHYLINYQIQGYTWLSPRTATRDMYVQLPVTLESKFWPF